ncbi:TIGR02147 family protein [Bdellovibrio sp. HCB209]|uniref:TIGR02147 family protein n=1 Tax=Bdellovibrio sp. HCB209 TaxID=3394354 RepID=UPI0039B41CC5
MNKLQIWQFSNYRDYLKAFIQYQPNGGRGQASKISSALGIHTTLFSQILNGHRDLTLEQGALFCDFDGMNESEADLFLNMVSLERAGNESLRKRLKKQIEEQKATFSEVRKRIGSVNKKLTTYDQSVFYSSWKYSAIRMLASLEKVPDLNEMAQMLDLTRQRLTEMVDFMLEKGLLVEEKGRVRIGAAKTHVDAKSQWATRHHTNWRTRNLTRLEVIADHEICFTVPFSCTKEDYKKIREIFLQAIEDASKIVGNSDGEETHVLCMDLFDMI